MYKLMLTFSYYDLRSPKYSPATTTETLIIQFKCYNKRTIFHRTVCHFDNILAPHTETRHVALCERLLTKRSHTSSICRNKCWHSRIMTSIQPDIHQLQQRKLLLHKIMAIITHSILWYSIWLRQFQHTSPKRDKEQHYVLKRSSQ